MKQGLIVALVTLFAFLSRAEADDAPEVSARFSPADVRAGEVTVLAVTVQVPSGYHLYSMTRIEGGPLPLKLSVASEEGLEPVSEWVAPPPKTEMGENFKKEVEYFEGRVVHQRAFRVTGEPGDAEPVPVLVKGQICDEHRCIPFKDTPEASLSIGAGDPRPEHTEVPELKGEVVDDGPPLGEGLIGFIIIAFVFGLIALTTPCVFPMIPITVSFFSKYAKVSMRRAVIMAAIYAGAIILTFTFIGVAVSVIFGAASMQSLSASALFNLFLTALLVVFAFSLFGLFEIRMPSWLITKTAEKERALASKDGSLFGQALGVFFMALTFTLVSFTCTVYFVGFVLAEAAKGNWFYPAVGMFAFSVAFALPFFFLAIFPSWAEKLQGKGGDWMVAVKVVLGFLELARALKFLSNVDLVWQWGVITRPLALAVWAAIFSAAGLYLLRIFNLPHGDADARHVGPFRMVFALLMFALAIYAAAGIRDQKSMGGWLDGWLPPAVYPGTEAHSETGDEMSWIVNDIDAGMRRAKAEGKPLFIDFTGYTCTNCRYMEGAVFPKGSVRRRLERMVRVSAYTDCEEAVCETQRSYQVDRFDTAALPFYAIIDPFDDTVLAKHPDMTNDITKYLAFLDSGLQAFERRHPAAPAETKAAEAQPSAPKTEASPPPVLAAEGEPVDFELPALTDGKKTRLSAFRGRWVFLNFWASWCKPCLKELKEEFPPALATAKHIRLVTVAFDGEETKPAALAFAAEAGITNTPILLGGEDITEAGLPAAFAVDENLPISYLIHPKGHIAWTRKGAVTKAELIPLFARAIPPATEPLSPDAP